ncbi:MAG: hypothetical protein J5507_00080 [Clostridia bacterium]|nr:hypothetical protein [Clostridia bacterium]
MESVNNYTVAELIEKYKIYFYDLIDILLKTYFDPEQITEAKRCVRDNLKVKGAVLFSPQYAKMEKEELYSFFIGCIKSTDEINKNNSEKQNVLSILYKECSNKMNRKQINELRNLLFGNYEYIKLTYKKNGVAFDYEVIYRGEPERVDSISNETLKIIFKLAIEVATIEDIGSMISAKTGDAQLYEVIMNKLVIDFFVKEKKIPIEEYNKMMDDDGKCKELEMQYGDEFVNRYREYFENNLQLFNRTDLLLNTAARIMLGLRKHKGEDLEEVDALFLSGGNDEDKTDKEDYSVIILREISKELEKVKYEDIDYVIMSSQTKGKELIIVNKKSIKEFLDRCTQTEYISDKDVQNIIKGLLEGNFPEDRDTLRIANFGKNNLIDICKSYEARENRDPLKQKTLECSVKMIYHLLEQGKITEEKLLDLYVNGVINFEIINQINLERLEKGLINKKFKAIYDEALYSNNENKKENKLSKFSALYKKFEEDGLADTNELLEMLLNAYGGDNKIGILSDLNRFGILTVEQCVEEAGIHYLIAKYREGFFVPVQIRELYDNSKISIDEIATFIKNIPENKKKYMAIGAIFPGENEDDCIDRDVLVAECINIDNGITTKTGRQRHIVDPRHKSDETITDPFARLSLIKELDEDYELEMTSDGHVIVKCLNSKKVIIEKLLDKNGNPYYGAATYVLDEDYYKKNEINICISDMIDRHELSTNAKIKGVDKIPHDKDKWGDKIKEIFGVEKEEKYTQERITRINEAIARVERSRKSRLEI